MFRQHRVRKVLIPGSGYGRNSKLFSTAGFDVTGIEPSVAACQLARQFDPATRVVNASFFDHDFGCARYDAIGCFSVLHLFLESERRLFLEKCAQVLGPHGLLFFTVVSEHDRYSGQGQRLEDNTFEIKPGKILHFFTEPDLRQHFCYKADGSDWELKMKVTGEPELIEGTLETAILPQIRLSDAHLILAKTRYSAFFKTNLADLLRASDVQRVVVVGGYTHYCVNATVFDAYSHDFVPGIITDAVTSHLEDESAVMIARMRRNGYQVMSTRDFIGEER